MTEPIGLNILYTGDGKGKTTAGLGQLLRARGNGLRCACIQFLKEDSRVIGEKESLKALGIPLYTLGKGFVFETYDAGKHADAAREALDLTKSLISGGTLDMLMLDEITYPMQFGWIDPVDFLAWLRENRAAGMHLIFTGRNAPQPLIDACDLVSEIREVKHPYARGIPAQKGIEF